MKRESAGPILSTVFVDYDNIYLSLKRKSEEAAKRFAKDSNVWLQGIYSGELITPTSPFAQAGQRRIVMNRCYGNPVPRRNAHDNSTDMNSFPFIRHHFLRSGFEVIDCPPLTAQLKNSADIRIVMDIRDILNHDTYFDEFIILSGDADFTPLLHRLRAHARRTVVFANDHTAQPYTAISDGEIRESNLIAALLGGRTAITGDSSVREIANQSAQPVIDIEAARKDTLTEVVNYVRIAPQAVPLETLADRAVRIVGRDKTIGTNWGGYGSFRDLLLADLPDDIHLSDTPPYTVFDANRHISPAGLIAAPLEPNRQQTQIPIADQSQAMPARQSAPLSPSREPQPQMQPQAQGQQPLSPQSQARAFQPAPAARPMAPHQQPVHQPEAPAQPPMQSRPYRSDAAAPAAPHTAPRQQQQPAPYRSEPQREPVPQAAAAPPPAVTRSSDQATQIQQSIARIHEACQAPALAPAEYRVLFDVMAQEIAQSGLQGAQTLVNIAQRAREFGLDVKRDDLRFILEVVSESDPWFEQGASANLFASRFRNFVVARCRSQGLSLSADELDLVEAWFSAPQPQAARPNPARTQTNAAPGAAPAATTSTQTAPVQPSGDRWWTDESQKIPGQRPSPAGYGPDDSDDEFPRIVRSRLRG
jgi:hypothetical protein